MGTFPKRKFRGAADSSSFAARYRALMQKRPFLLFGLPFMTVIVGGSFILTPATAIRYERQDRRVRQLTRDEELGMGKNKRRVDMKEEYYVRRSLPSPFSLGWVADDVDRGSRPRTSIIGSRGGWRGCPGRAMVF